MKTTTLEAKLQMILASNEFAEEMENRLPPEVCPPDHDSIAGELELDWVVETRPALEASDHPYLRIRMAGVTGSVGDRRFPCLSLVDGSTTDLRVAAKAAGRRAPSDEMLDAIEEAWRRMRDDHEERRKADRRAGERVRRWVGI